MNDIENKELVVDVKFKIRDVLRYNISVAVKSMVNKIILLVGIVLIGVYFYKLITRNYALDLFIANNILLLLIPVMIFLLIPWRVWKITLEQMQMPAFAFGVTYIFSLDKIILDIGTTKDEMQWELFAAIKETKNDIRFFVDSVRAQLIPKHNLTKEELELLKAIAMQATKKEVCQFNKQ